jgi:hypothetical protein
MLVDKMQDTSILPEVSNFQSLCKCLRYTCRCLQNLSFISLHLRPSPLFQFAVRAYTHQSICLLNIYFFFFNGTCSPLSLFIPALPNFVYSCLLCGSLGGLLFLFCFRSLFWIEKCPSSLFSLSPLSPSFPLLVDPPNIPRLEKES